MLFITSYLTIICCAFLFKTSYAAEECPRAQWQDLDFNVVCACESGTAATLKDGFYVSETDLKSCNYYQYDQYCSNPPPKYSDCPNFYCDEKGQAWCDKDKGCELECPGFNDAGCGCYVPWVCKCPEGSGEIPGIKVGEPCEVNVYSDLSEDYITVTGYKEVDAPTCRQTCSNHTYTYDSFTQCCYYKLPKNTTEYTSQYEITQRTTLTYGDACPTEVLPVSCKEPYYHEPGDSPYCEYSNGEQDANIYILTNPGCHYCDKICIEDTETTTHICADNPTSQKSKTYMNGKGFKYDISTNNCEATTAYAGISGSVTENPERFQRKGKVMWKDGLCEFVYLDEWGCAPGYQKQGGSIGTDMPDFICVPCSANQYYDENTQSCKSCPTAFISPATNNTGTVTLSIKECYIDSGSGKTAIKLTDSLGSIFLHEEIGTNVKLYHQ